MVVRECRLRGVSTQVRACLPEVRRGAQILLCSVDHHEVPRPQLRFRAARSTRAALQAATASQESGGRADESSLVGRDCVGTTWYGNGALPAQRSLDGETALLPSRVSRDVVPAALPLKARRVYNYLQAPRGSLYTMTVTLRAVRRASPLWSCNNGLAWRWRSPCSVPCSRDGPSERAGSVWTLERSVEGGKRQWSSSVDRRQK